MSKRRKSGKRTRCFFMIGSLTALLLVGGVCAMKLTAFAAERSGRVAYSSVCIRQGDTLWSIAEEYCGADDAASIMAYVDKIARINGISSRQTIYPGGYLMVERQLSGNE